MSPSVDPQAIPDGAVRRDTALHGAVRRMRSAAHRYGLAWLPRTYPASDRPLSIVVPMAEKDLVLGPHCLAHLKQHLQHPISRIVVPGQKSKALSDFCKNNGYHYIDENDLLPACIKTLVYHADGRNRNGWIRQQTLKLSSFSFVEDDLAFVCDSDTIFLRPFSMLEGARQVLFEADEYIDSYHDMSMRLLGPHQRYRWSFVTHCMLFQRPILADLQRAIESRHNMTWQEAIVSCLDTTVGAGMAEFELYGNYVYTRHPDAFVGRYWYNRKIPLRGSNDVERAASNWATKRFNSVSDHVRPG